MRLLMTGKTLTCLGMRDCTICDKGVLSDEIHFLYECTKLDNLRTKYLSSCNRLSPNVNNCTHMLQTSEPDKINGLTKSSCLV